MKKPFKFLIIHCTATREGQNVTPDDIVRWHTSPPPHGRGWRRVGYSDMIMLDGSRRTFVKHNGDKWIDDAEITNGVKGFNSISRHVVYVGGLNKEGTRVKNTLNDAQSQTLAAIIDEVLRYQPDVLIAGHNQFDNKGCPSFWVPNYLESLWIPERNIYEKDPFGYGDMF
jgi:N-acetylmuramoyl-L-alanine amidase